MTASRLLPGASRAARRAPLVEASGAGRPGRAARVLQHRAGVVVQRREQGGEARIDGAGIGGPAGVGLAQKRGVRAREGRSQDIDASHVQSLCHAAPRLAARGRPAGRVVSVTWRRSGGGSRFARTLIGRYLLRTGGKAGGIGSRRAVAAGLHAGRHVPPPAGAVARQSHCRCSGARDPPSWSGVSMPVVAPSRHACRPIRTEK